MSEFKEFCLIKNLSPVQIIGARKAWQHQEAGQHSMKAHIDELQESNLNLEGECVHLQKRIDTALNLIGNWWHPDVDQKLFLTELERVLQGGDQNLKNTSQTIENTVVEGGAQNALRGGHE